MPWVQITCQERDQLKAAGDLMVIASCTDLDAEFHSEPEVFTEWGDRATEAPVLREHRFPARTYAGDAPGAVRPDRKPCEHYRFEEQR